PRSEVRRRVPSVLLAAGHAHVGRQPALPRPLERETQTPHFGRIAFRLRGLQLTQQREKPLVQRDLLGSRLVTVVELATHAQRRTPPRPRPTPSTRLPRGRDRPCPSFATLLVCGRAYAPLGALTRSLGCVIGA